jgi:hypothetical protein
MQCICTYQTCNTNLVAFENHKAGNVRFLITYAFLVLLVVSPKELVSYSMHFETLVASDTYMNDYL